MKVEVNPAYYQFIDEIKSIPDIFDKEGENIYTGRNQLKLLHFQGMDFIVKSFKIPHVINKIAYSFIRLSKARRSYEYSFFLKTKGINSPEPVAYIENKKFGLLNNSYYISVRLDYTGMMRELKTGKLEGREGFLCRFAQFTAFVHEHDILHLDYSPGNILYKQTEGDYVFYLVDINRMTFGPVSMKQGCKNFRKLWGNNEMIAFIATEYAKARGFDVNKCIDLTLFYHKKFWKKFSKQHKGSLPYIDEQ